MDLSYVILGAFNWETVQTHWDKFMNVHAEVVLRAAVLHGHVALFFFFF